MKDEIISFETAKLAKEKGFKEFCSNGFDDRLEGIEPFGIGNGEISSTHSIDYFDNKGDNHLYARPTQSLLQRWLREVHEIDIEIELTDNSRHSYYESSIKKQDIRDYNDEDCFDQVRQVHIKGKFKTYEQALEKGLQEALKLIIKK